MHPYLSEYTLTMSNVPRQSRMTGLSAVCLDFLRLPRRAGSAALLALGVLRNGSRNVKGDTTFLVLFLEPLLALFLGTRRMLELPLDDAVENLACPRARLCPKETGYFVSLQRSARDVRL